MTSDSRGDLYNLAAACLRARAEDAATAGRPALSFLAGGSIRSWTYAELWNQVVCIARGLLAHGLGPGDRLLLRLPHSPEYALAFFGANAAGLVPVPLSPQLTTEEAAFLARDTQARALVATAERVLPDFGGLVILSETLAALDGGGRLPETHAEDPAYMLYTSGTTAHPKGVMHAQRVLRGREAMRGPAWADLRATDVTMHAGTLNWSYTLGAGLMDPWCAGGHALLVAEGTEPARWSALIAQQGVSVFIAVPTVYRQMLKYGRPEQADLSRLRHGLCAGEALPPTVAGEWRTRVGIPLYESLGMTEISTYISSGPAVPVRDGSPGRAQPGRRVAVLPESRGEGDQPLPAGAVGLLAVHRSDPGLMLGYWQRPGEEETALRGEWFVGGDRASIDVDGYVWFHGRADDVIKSFGYRLSPVEIETVLSACAGVADVAVVGDAIDAEKTLVMACVVSEPGMTVEEPTLRAYAATHLAEYKQPHEYRFVETLPRTANGKLQRSAVLRQLRGG